jgi:outer membrane protein OmpA-like peptidoglycan-associated protein
MKYIKKILAVALAVVAFEPAFSQESNEVKYEYNPHFFLQVQGGAAYTVGEASFGDLISPAAALNLGYSFNPYFALRIGASGWQARGSWTVPPTADYKYKYVQGNLDAMWNITNTFCGFNPKRVFSSYLFVGAGFNHAFDNDEAVAISGNSGKLQYLWDPNKNFVAGRAGLGVGFRLSDYVDINVEVNANMLSDKFNSKYGDNPDWQINGLIGLTFRFGKSYKEIIPAPVYVEPTPEPEPVVEPEPEPAPAPVVEQPKVAPFNCNIFFTINSSKISKTEMEKVDKLVEYLQAHPNAEVEVTGYADKGTGTAAINQRISERRAAIVANELVSRGIDANRIKQSAKGDTVQPFAINNDNRVTICVAEPK